MADQNEQVVTEEEQNVEEEEEELEVCTYAITKNKPVFQPMYTCHTCLAAMPGVENVQNMSVMEMLMKLCISQSCAYECHEKNGCEIEYLGIGHSYCDCSSLISSPDIPCSCTLLEKSQKIASDLGISEESSPCNPKLFLAKEEDEVENPEGSSDDEKFPYECSVYFIPSLSTSSPTPNLRQQIIAQAMELTKHTKETHWIPAGALLYGDSFVDNLTEIEKLGLSIFKRHYEHYNLEKSLLTDNDIKPEICGAEWWVQIQKNPRENEDEVGAVASNSKDSPLSATLNSSPIDLHYDKDEILAETFGLGNFPLLSTVTYVSSPSNNKKPTMIFPHQYEQGEETPISEFVLSYPSRGKHLVFDGRLLHGAPNNAAFYSSSALSGAEDQEQEEQYRITFLVNLWISGKPAGISELSDEIRVCLRNASASSSNNNSIELDDTSTMILSEKTEIPTLYVNKEETVNNTTERTHLPFVSSDATWIDFEETDEPGLVVSLYPPPSSLMSFLEENDSTTVRLKYDPENEEIHPWLTRGLDYEDNGEEAED